MTNNSVAPGEQMALAAFRHHRAIDRRAHALLDPNLGAGADVSEPRAAAAGVRAGGRQRRCSRDCRLRVDSDRLAVRLLDRYSTLVVPGRFFESPRHIRISFGCQPSLLARGLDEHFARAGRLDVGHAGPPILNFLDRLAVS